MIGRLSQHTHVYAYVHVSIYVYVGCRQKGRKAGRGRYVREA